MGVTNIVRAVPSYVLQFGSYGGSNVNVYSDQTCILERAIYCSK